MATELQDLFAFLAVVQAGGFREGARASGTSASALSEAVRRLETRLGVRLLNRTTRSVLPTEAGARLAERLVPALGEVEAALDVVNSFRDRPTGTLKLNVPATVARLVLPSIVTPFLKTYPEIRLEVIVEDSFVDMLAAGCDAGIRYDYFDLVTTGAHVSPRVGVAYHIAKTNSVIHASYNDLFSPAPIEYSVLAS